MSDLPGKVVVDGVADVGGRRMFVLSFLQGRNPNWCKRPFFAEYDRSASWLTDLRPAFGESTFFYEAELRRLLEPPASDHPPTDGKPVFTPVELPRQMITTAA
ncbi:MAG: hypothetical protein FJ276_37170 [Planctomycetes bacterium]|nr:hypothetical protein [Planctomycetota bacterium]